MTVKKSMIGITSTIPVEVLYAAGRIPVDLNNLFVLDESPQQLIIDAERHGLPRNSCAWVKGIYSVIRKYNIKEVIGVVQGDCSPLITMLETLLPSGIVVYPFSYPYGKQREFLRIEIQKLMTRFGVQWDGVEATHHYLNEVRKLAHQIDERTWRDGLFGSQDNFNALINCTDFKGDPKRFKQELITMMQQPKDEQIKPLLKLGMLGIPGVFTDLLHYLETKLVQVVYHEIPRQFAMPNYNKGLLEQYLTYTYPYSIDYRLRDIIQETETRQLDGYIHYVQAFCHHQLEDRFFKNELDRPVLTLEGDRVGPVDGRTKTRIDAFIEMLIRKKRNSL